MPQCTSTQKERDYTRIAKAIDYLHRHVKTQPSLEEIAQHVHLSPFHFQKLFSRWAGVSPKKFLQILTVEAAKQTLAQSASLLNTSEALGLSSSSRLYDHFIKIEAVTPNEFRQQGQGLTITYNNIDTPFGTAFIASTQNGICTLCFYGAERTTTPLHALKAQWPNAQFTHTDNATEPNNHRQVRNLFSAQALPNQYKHQPITLHLHGTNFQINVWKLLLQIPPATLASYSQVAAGLGKPKAARAVGSAIGANPIAFIIPCHRVIQQSGALGGYRWGLIRKLAINAWETAQN